MPACLHPPTSPDVSAIAVLRDGTAVTVRPMRADDGERLVAFHEALSPETQFLRFFSAHAHLSEREVDRFTHVDHLAREAVVAERDGAIVGVGRFDLLGTTGDAEVAFVVADELQGQGLGTLLLTEVAERAARLGITRLVADTLLHNDRMLAVFRHAGLPMTSRFEDGVVRVTLTLGGGR